MLPSGDLEGQPPYGVDKIEEVNVCTTVIGDTILRLNRFSYLTDLR